MKDIYFEYYYPDEVELKKLWNSGIIVPDTNVLLNLYRYSEDTREQFLTILDHVKDRLWLPHHVGYEFHKDRSLVIKKQEHFYKSVTSLIMDYEKKIIDDVNKKFSEKGVKHHPYIEKEKLVEDIQTKLKSVRDSINKMEDSHPKLLNSDPILERITLLFEGRVGSPYTATELKDIYSDGAHRYLSEIPPGYMDNDKKGSAKYGDLVIWKQMMDKAKIEKTPVLFVTSDAKKDWWLIGEATEKISPRYELIKEMYDFAGVGFHIYDMEYFIDSASTYLTIVLDENKIQSAVEEIKKLGTVWIDSGDLASSIPTNTGNASVDTYLDSIEYPDSSNVGSSFGAKARMAGAEQASNPVELNLDDFPKRKRSSKRNKGKKK